MFLKGTAALYSKEYFESVKQHLNPGGMFTLYVPLYETDEPTIKSELATFFEAFPYGTVWVNTRDGFGYDTVFMGEKLTPLKINLDEIDQRANRPDYASVRQSLREVGINSSLDLFSTYTANAAGLAPWLTRRRAKHRWESAAELFGRLGNQREPSGRPLPGDAAVPPPATGYFFWFTGQFAGILFRIGDGPARRQHWVLRSMTRSDSARVARAGIAFLMTEASIRSRWTPPDRIASAFV